MGAQGFYMPGCKVDDGRVTDHVVCRVMYTGNGRTGVLVSNHDGRNYAVWIQDVMGNLILTMQTDDRAAALRSFGARVTETLRWEREPDADFHGPLV